MQKQEIEERLYDSLIGVPYGQNTSCDVEERFEQLIKKLPNHIRWRAIQKSFRRHTTKEQVRELADNDLEYYVCSHAPYKREVCPICNQIMSSFSWKEEIPHHGMREVEEQNKCPNGCYERSWSYGLTSISVKGNVVLTYHPHQITWDKEQALMMSIVNPLVQKERDKRERLTRLLRKKNKTQSKR